MQVQQRHEGSTRGPATGGHTLCTDQVQLNRHTTPLPTSCTRPGEHWHASAHPSLNTMMPLLKLGVLWCNSGSTCDSGGTGSRRRHDNRPAAGSTRAWWRLCSHWPPPSMPQRAVGRGVRCAPTLPIRVAAESTRTAQTRVPRASSRQMGGTWTGHVTVMSCLLRAQGTGGLQEKGIADYGVKSMVRIAAGKVGSVACAGVFEAGVAQAQRSRPSMPHSTAQKCQLGRAHVRRREGAKLRRKHSAE
jgi:hypothetical protein